MLKQISIYMVIRQNMSNFEVRFDGASSWGINLTHTTHDDTFNGMVNIVNEELGRQLQISDVTLLPTTETKFRNFYNNKIATYIDNPVNAGNALKITITIKIGRVTITIIINV